MTYYGRWTYKYEEAARRGAAGVLIVHETAPASYGWSVVKNSNTITMFDIVRQNPAAEHPAFESWIQRPLAEQIFAASGLNFDQAKAAAKLRGFRPVPLKATLTANIQAAISTITSHNVVGLLPGSKYPDETIIYTAHWDHLGIGKPDASGDAIYNGAVDNGTGIAQLIEQARAFARDPRPDRSVVFLAVTAEEKGLLGSEYYAAHPLYPAGQDGSGSEHRRARHVWADAQLLDRGHRQARPARRPDRRGQARRPLFHARFPPRRPAASTAPTISPSPRSASPRSASIPATISWTAASSAARRWATIMSPNAITSPATNGPRAWTFAASPTTR